MTADEVPWQQFDHESYLDANYRTVLDADRTICEALAARYGELADAGRRGLRVLDVGTGPNLYPLIAALPVAERIDCGDFSMPNNEYLRSQLARPSAHWGLFAEVMAGVHPMYRRLPWQELLVRRVRPHAVDVYNLPGRTYDVVSSFFVSESITDSRGRFSVAGEEAGQFTAAVSSLVRAVRPGGLVVLALMAGSHGYATAGPEFPAVPVDAHDVRAALVAAGCSDPEVVPVDVSVREGHDGMYLVFARVPEQLDPDGPRRAATSIEVLHVEPRHCTAEHLARQLDALRQVISPVTLADATVMVMVDDYSLRGRPARVHKAAQAAADALCAAAALDGLPVDAVVMESALTGAAGQLAGMLDSDSVTDGVLSVPGSYKTDPRTVTLWTVGDDGERRYTCPMMAAAWQACRLGLLAMPEHRRLSDRPLVAETSLTCLDAMYLPVEASVMAILSAVRPVEVADSIVEHLGWVMVPALTKGFDLPDIEPLVPSEGVDWPRIDVGDYVGPNYSSVLPVDEQVATRLRGVLAEAGDGADYVDVGAGPNLYPSMAAARCASVVAWEYSSQFCDYLEGQYRDADAHWAAFAPVAGAPADWQQQLARKGRVVRGGVLDLPEETFDVASMLFVAECVDGTWPGFATSVASAVRCLRPGGRLLVASMERSEDTQYSGVDISLVSVDATDMMAALTAAGAVDVHVEVLVGPEAKVREGHRGVIVATARRAPAPVGPTGTVDE